jgi:transposase InsO family protein
MPWREVSVMEQRREFVRLALQEGANRRELCRRFGISRQTGYKWLLRGASGESGLADRSRRPHRSPGRSDCALEAAVLALRDEHPVWGARKLAACLKRKGHAAPAISTVHAILKRNGRIMERPGGPAASLRFEMEAPNQLWQMDFKGWVVLADGKRCHALTIVDDHSRYALCIAACGDEQSRTVQGLLEQTFRRYGLPDGLFVDNGSPWGDASGAQWTRLKVWLLKLGIRLLHSRPYHPQSRGKNERFHRTLKAEVYDFNRFRNLAEAQKGFDHWREIYNLDRPHQALGQQVPASRYRPSSRAMPANLVQAAYDDHEVVRRVPLTKDYVQYKGGFWKVPKSFRGEYVAIRPIATDGRMGIFFGAHRIATIDLTVDSTSAKSVNHVPERVSAMSPD